MRVGIEEGKEMEKNKLGKYKREGKSWKRELISTIGSNCGMITPYGLSRIHNLYDWALPSILLWSRT
jgi:hypothetical protein